MANDSNTILLQTNGALGATYERLADGTISPGHILELTSANKFKVHSTEDGNMVPFVAREDVLQGNGISDDYDDADQVVAFIPRPGDVFYARLLDGETTAIGSELDSAGDGTLKVRDTSGAVRDVPVKLIALEVVDMSGSSGADPDGFVKVMRI